MTEVPATHRPIVVPSPLAAGERFVLDAAGVRALMVREVNVKEAFTVCDGRGAFFRASLLACTATRAEAVAYEPMPASPESPARITLACAVLARQRMMIVMQKATELGVASVAPVFTERSVGPEGLAHEKAHAWPGQVVRAMRQCRRASVPVVAPSQPFAAFLKSPAWRDAGARFYLDDRAPAHGGSLALPPRATHAAPLDVVLAVGPEGGFTDAERARLGEQRGVAPLALGGRVLRAETAVIVGLTLLQHHLGDLVIL